MKSKLKAWLQLLRIPNLLTVPGDPLAGYFLAVRGEYEMKRVAAAVTASLLFYAAGLLLNDVFDFACDREERPERPLPSGRASRMAAAVLGALLLAAGAAVCAGLGPLASRVGLVLIAAILLYDGGVKKWPFVGPLLMGACRALSVLLGAVAQPSVFSLAPPVTIAAVVIGLYIVMVSQLARHEMAPERAGKIRSLHVGVLAAGMLVFLALSPPLASVAWLGFIGAFLAAILLSLTAAYRLIWYPRRLSYVADENWSMRSLDTLSDPPVSAATSFFPSVVGLLIGNLLFIQAAFCMSAGHHAPALWTGVALLIAWPVNRILSARFYAS